MDFEKLPTPTSQYMEGSQSNKYIYISRKFMMSQMTYTSFYTKFATCYLWKISLFIPRNVLQATSSTNQYKHVFWMIRNYYKRYYVHVRFGFFFRKNAKKIQYTNMKKCRRKQGIMGHISLSTNFHLRELYWTIFNGHLSTLRYLLSTTKAW